MVYVPVTSEPLTRLGYPEWLTHRSQYVVDGVPCNQYTIVHDRGFSLTLCAYSTIFGVTQPVYFEVMRCEIIE